MIDNAIDTAPAADAAEGSARHSAGDAQSEVAAGRPPARREPRHDHPHDEDDDHDEGHHPEGVFGWTEAWRIFVVLVCALATWQSWPDVQPPLLTIGDSIYLPFSWYAVVGLLFGAWPIFRAAFHDILRRRMTMELSMSIAILAGAYTGYFLPTLIITFFVLVAEILEGMTVERGRRAIRALLDLLPRQVIVRRESGVGEIATDDLHVGDIVLVPPGSAVPVDGAVVGGHSFVDESRITGESMPVEKVSGARVFAGSMNQSGAMEIRTERIGRDTSYGKIIEAVERAERSRAPIARLSDRLAGYIVVMALLFAGYTYWQYSDVTEAISIIIVAGACGIAAGTPLAILGAIGRSARLGAIVKGGRHIEMLGKVNTVVLDKTGTLTFGRPEVQRVSPAAGVSEDELLRVAAIAEMRSEHALGKAIVARAMRVGATVPMPEQFDYTPGRGISALHQGARIFVGNAAWMEACGVAVPADPERGAGGVSEVLVAQGERFLGSIAIADTVRPEARRAIEQLRKMRMKVILLTGDTAAVASAVAARLGIDDFEAELLPEQKVERVEALVGRRRIVAMVGDGINDAPALAVAHVGVAMGSGTDVARESADVVLLGNDLERFVDTVAVARRARRIIWFNVVGTILVDCAGMTGAYYSYVGPYLASIIHTASEFGFILNSARLVPMARWRPWSGRRSAGEDEAAASAKAPAYPVAAE